MTIDHYIKFSKLMEATARRLGIQVDDLEQAINLTMKDLELERVTLESGTILGVSEVKKVQIFNLEISSSEYQNMINRFAELSRRHK